MASIAVFAIFSAGAVYCQQTAAAKSTIPVVDAGLGRCSAVFTATDPAGRPVYNAKIRVHIAYGFLSARKLDLEVGTNAEGKARFEGLPAKVKRPLDFLASYEELRGSSIVDPGETCKAEHIITMQKP